jgi:hypothetical protein
VLAVSYKPVTCSEAHIYKQLLQIAAVRFHASAGINIKGRTIRVNMFLKMAYDKKRNSSFKNAVSNYDTDGVSFQNLIFDMQHVR